MSIRIINRFLLHLIFIIISTSRFSHGKLKIELEGGVESGIFLQLPSNSESEPNGTSTSYPSSSSSSPSSISSTDIRYFTPLKKSRSLHVRASFGPIQVTETILPSYTNPGTTNLKTQGKTSQGSIKTLNNGSRDKIKEATLVEGDQVYGRDSIAYLVTRQVHRNNPVLRVLFYSTHPTISTSIKANVDEARNIGHDVSPCIFISVSKDEESLYGYCSPTNDREGACLVELTLPAYWWPPVELDTASPKSGKPSLATVDYKISKTNQCADGSLMDHIRRLKNVDAFSNLGVISLMPFTGGYEEVTNDDIVRILIPQQPTYPNSKIYIPVCFRYNPNYPMAAFRIRARVKSGLRIVAAQPSPRSPWKVTVEINNKQTLATVTAKLKEDSILSEALPSDDQGMHLLLSQEIFSWLIQVDENVEFSDNGRIVWQLEYVTEIGFDAGQDSTKRDFDRDLSKLSSILDIQKDDIQAVIGITTSLSMINTAVLTGKQVAQPLRVFVVSQAGRVGDVTLQASCSSADESVIKVSPSCTSIYLDGSEIRGSSNATILIKYGTYTGQANFVVWTPKLPLEMSVSDSKLSQIKGWKIPHLKRDSRSFYHNGGRENSIFNHHHKSRRSSRRDLQRDERNSGGSTESDIGCKLRHQQAYIQVFAQFFSTDHNSGRESYLLNRKILVQVTDLVSPFLRISDPRIAIVRGNIVEGLTAGRTEIQAVSPISGKILATKDIRVASDKEMITQLEVNLVAGLSLQVKPEGNIGNVWSVNTKLSSKLVNQYQEGLLDIKVHFSDETVVSLSDISDSDFQLSINTFDNGAIAYAPLIGQPYPRVIAIGQGKGQLHVSLEVSDQCQRKRTQPLAMSYVNADVDLNLPPVHLQNDADFRKYNGILVHRNQSQFNSRQEEDHSITSRGLNIIDYPSIEPRSNRAMASGELTPLEIGMYSLLGVFTLAFTLFIVSCLIFRFKGKQSSDLMVATLPVPGHCSTSNQKVVANANDWVWLGKATLQRSSPNTSNNEVSQGLISLTDFNGNPIINATGTQTEANDMGLNKENGSNRMSTISHPGSEISIRITTNPVEEHCLDQQHQQLQQQDSTPKPSSPFGVNKEIQKFSRSLSPLSLSSIPPPVPARRTKGPVNNHIQPPGGGLPASSEKPIIIPNHKPPHIPPRLTRHIRSDQVADVSSSSRPPPVPPHSNSSRSSKPPLPPHRTVPPKTKRTVANSKTTNNVKKTKETKNLIACSALEDMTQEKWNQVTKDMNYKQLMEYFQNLKESSA